MKLLLDTHVVLWWLDDPSQVSAAARAEISDPRNVVLVSAVTAWEIAIKRRLGKLSAPDDFEHAIASAGFGELAVTVAHALLTEMLPDHHRDPFDRLLVAQARHEGCALISRDPLIRQYALTTHILA